MRNTVALMFATCLIVVSAVAWTVAEQSKPAQGGPSVDEVLKSVRADLQGERADIIAKNVTLNAAQAAKFWPMFESYQKEQNVIIDEQLKGIQRFVENYQNLDDAAALALMNAHFDRDDKMNALRKRWLGEFQSIVGTKIAVRVLQIDRRLSMAHQVAFTSQIPLVR